MLVFARVHTKIHRHKHARITTQTYTQPIPPQLPPTKRLNLKSESCMSHPTHPLLFITRDSSPLSPHPFTHCKVQNDYYTRSCTSLGSYSHTFTFIHRHAALAPNRGTHRYTLLRLSHALVYHLTLRSKTTFTPRSCTSPGRSSPASPSRPGWR